MTQQIDSEVGEYGVCLCDANGGELCSFIRATNQRYPHVGEALSICVDDQQQYRVADVRNVGEHTFSSLRLTKLIVTVHAEDSLHTKTEDVDMRTNIAPPRSSKVIVAPNVVPFAPVSFDAFSPLLGFFALLAGAVVGGYSEQAHQFDRLRLASWQLDWSGKRWVVRLLSGLSTNELRSLSRQAGRQADVAAEAFARIFAAATSARGGLGTYKRGKDRS